MSLVFDTSLYMNGGAGGGVSLDKIIVKSDTIPAAAAKYDGAVYQYVGETNSTYTHGYIYECVESGSTYAWERIDVQPGATYTAGNGISISNGTISVTSPTLTNTATGANSLTIGGTSTSDTYGINIGSSTIGAYRSVAIGANARSNGMNSVVVGFAARAGASSVAIGSSSRAIGFKTISIGSSGFIDDTVQNSIVLGSSNTPIEDSNKFFVVNGNSQYELLDLTTGLIPNERLSSNVQTTTNLVTSVSSSSTDTQYPSAKLLYDTVGNIEATLDAIIAQGSNS